MNTMKLIQKFKKGNRIICYIVKNNVGYHVHTGRPSDKTCISWTYETLKEARATAKEITEHHEDANTLINLLFN